jgi:hypothetical protein
VNAAVIAAIRWAHTVPGYCHHRTGVTPDKVEHLWAVDGASIELRLYPGNLAVAEIESPRGYVRVTANPADPQQLLDTLVACRLLPAQFSSAYRAGQEAGRSGFALDVAEELQRLAIREAS